MYGDYEILDDGRVYSHKTNKYLKPDITKLGYAQYTLFINGIPERHKAHRLVAKYYCKNPNPLKYNQVNHIDGNKLNNNYYNLEWCDAYYNNKHARDNKLNDVPLSNSERWKDLKFREKTSKNISEGILKSESNKGKNNPRFRYLIIDSNGEEYTREELATMIGKAQSTTDIWIRRCSQGRKYKPFEEFNIKIIDTKENQQTIEKVS